MRNQSGEVDHIVKDLECHRKGEMFRSGKEWLEGESLEPWRVNKRLCRSAGRSDKGWDCRAAAQDGGLMVGVGLEEWITLGQIPFVSQTWAGLVRIRPRGCHLG